MQQPRRLKLVFLRLEGGTNGVGRCYSRNGTYIDLFCAAVAAVYVVLAVLNVALNAVVMVAICILTVHGIHSFQKELHRNIGEKSKNRLFLY